MLRTLSNGGSRIMRTLSAASNLIEEGEEEDEQEDEYAPKVEIVIGDGDHGNGIGNGNGNAKGTARNSRKNRNSLTLSTTSSTGKTAEEEAFKWRRLRKAFFAWAKELLHADPRFQILEFFNDVAKYGAGEEMNECEIHDTGVCTQSCLEKQAVGAVTVGEAGSVGSVGSVAGGATSKKKKNGVMKMGTDRKNRGIMRRAQSLREYTTGITGGIAAGLKGGRRRSSLRLSADEVSLLGLLGGCFDRASIFTVWRPTSVDAIRKMIKGEGVGKGLDIKGKSAKRGKLSAFVPVLQIYENKHKRMLRTVPKNAVMRIYYSSREARTVAQQTLQNVRDEMLAGYTEAQLVIKAMQVIIDTGAPLTTEQDEQREEALGRYIWEMDNPVISIIDQFAFADRFGLDVPQRLFLEAYIIRGDIIRQPSSEDDTGRPSQPAFQDMNLEALRSRPNENLKTASKTSSLGIAAPRPVAFQYNADPNMAMEPKDMVMAYEEQGRVLPVVSDFDCFLIGTRRVKYKASMSKEQVHMMQWAVDNIEKVLALPESDDTWTMRWLEILKHERVEHGFKPVIPRHGYADQKSYSIIAHAVDRLSTNGCVRHGAECFNYYFPQELDDEFLVISNAVPNGRWAQYTSDGLLDFLSHQIDGGFMFPLNPKWILCDPGWKKLYDKQMNSTSKAVRKSLNSWYPPKSGIRKRIEQVHKAYPNGFQRTERKILNTSESYSPLRSSIANGQNADISLALMELEHHDALQKAKRAIRAIIAANRMKRLLTGTRAAAASAENAIDEGDDEDELLKINAPIVKTLLVGDVQMDPDIDPEPSAGGDNCLIQ